MEAELRDFIVYREHKVQRRHQRVEERPRANELVSLHEMNEWNIQRLYFDGVIWHGGKGRYLQRIPFELLSIGGYEEMVRSEPRSAIWVQSVRGKKSGVWYRLTIPAPEYRQYHICFLWMADLSIYVVNYLLSHEHVKLRDFQGTFFMWLKNLYSSNHHLDRWLSTYGNDDFRHAVAAQANFLWCQATQVEPKLETQPLWAEIHPRFLTAIPEQIEQNISPDIFVEINDGAAVANKRKTTVTPYVYDCFKHLSLAKFLYC